MKTLIRLLNLFTFLILASCVGTVQEADTRDTQVFDKPTARFNYLGIINSRAVAEDKIEIEFFEAGASGYEYLLTINDSSKPITLDPNTLLPILGGKFLYTIKGLNINTEYKLKLTSKNVSLNTYSQNENTVYVKTYDNRVADFDGISQLTLVPGNASSEVKVDWLPKPMAGVIEASDEDAIRYEITYISEIGGVVNLNNSSYSGTDKVRITQPDESGCLDDTISTPCLQASPFETYSALVLKNLQPNTRYFVQVRAINKRYEKKLKDFLLNNVPIDANKESNTRYLTIRTAPATNEFEFDPESLILANAPGELSLNAINIYWAAGQGNFDHYRVFVKKYIGSDPLNDDQLDDATINTLNNSLGGYYIPGDPKDTFYQKDALEHLSWYQVKVALCKTPSCNLDPSLPDAGIVSKFKSIQIKPILAPFSGIAQIFPPGQYTQRDVVDLKFDAPILSAGHANRMEFYCVNPTNTSQSILLTTDPAVSSIANCNGLHLVNDPPSNLNNFTGIKVKGVQGDGTKQYCFSATPAIIGISPEYRLSSSERTIRCIYPEIVPPTVAQFPGIKQACQVENNTGKISWTLPTGGVYSGFVVFWREKSTLNKFSFAEAINGSPDYQKTLTALTADTLEFTVPDLFPGKTYQVGVLANVDMDPTQDLYSEYNLNIKDCNVPLPNANFKGFTRILALGPKLDGRIENDNSKRLPDTSRLYEAINQDGIPYEVPMQDLAEPHTDESYYMDAPGDTAPSGFNSYADTMPGSKGSLSKDGIISLAWEEVELSYPAAQTQFQGAQDHNINRANRLWGYRVYRSSDNKLTWLNVTPKNSSGLIHARDYTYYPRPNIPAVTKRMAFFTDYSVYAMSEFYDASKQLEVERARTYHYRIVPVFNNQELTHLSPDHHITRVTLPPPNMALVHRWMANRSRCMELGKTPNIGNNYTCAYNGLGAVAAGIPESTGNTILDQKGDLLVDRFELSCRFTRGDMVSDASTGRSAYERDFFMASSMSFFRGFPYLGPSTGETNQRFMGCVNGNNPSYQGTYPDNFVVDRRDVVQGDCIGTNYQVMANSECSSTEYDAGTFRAYPIITPGVPLEVSPQNCSLDRTPSSDWPKNIDAAYTYENRKKYVMQSEPLAVFHNRTSRTGYNLPIHGPGLGDSDAIDVKTRSWVDQGAASHCSINLAAIDGSGYMHPRWLTLNELSSSRVKFKGTYPDLLSKTVSEVTEVSKNFASESDLTLYNGDAENPADEDATFKKPNGLYNNTNRYRPETKIARVMTSNAAKLPPIGLVTPEGAQTLCRSYNVQVGVAHNADSFYPTTPILNKRSLRRTESVTASMWPDKYDATKINQIERSNNSTYAGACVNTVKNVTSQPNARKSARYQNNFAFDQGNTTLLTGSSAFNITSTDPQLYHSAACISKYGIQDLVGNVKEANSEQIFCDYSKDRIFMGPVEESTWASNIENSGLSEEDSVPFFNNTEEDDWFIVESGKLKTGEDISFTVKDHLGNIKSNFKPWVKISTDSGYCSVVDDRPARRENGSNAFTNGSQWISLFNPGGSLNTTMILRNQADQKSVTTLRNGDGRFLDFGPKGLLSSLNLENTLSLSGTLNAIKNKFFNPVVGLPLACNENSCDDENLASGSGTLSQNDNVSFTTTALGSNLTPTEEASVVISNFFLGNSQITNRGISSFEYTPPRTLNLNTAERMELTGYPLTELFLNADGDMLPPARTYNYPDDFQGDLTYSSINWGIARQTIFRMTSGGGFNEASTGRFSMDLASTTTDAAWIYNSSLGTGARCGILINED